MGLPQANGFCTAKKAPNKQVMNRMGGHTSKPYICYKWLLYEKEGNLTYSLVGMQISTTIMEVSMQISQISEKWSTIQLSQPSPRYIHKWNETITWKSDLYSCVNSSSFPDSDNIEPMEVDQLTTELRNQIHMTEHYSAIKKKSEILSSATKWRKLETNYIRTPHPEKKGHMFSLICGS